MDALFSRVGGYPNVLLLVGNDPHRPAADARISAHHRLAVLGSVFLEGARVHDAGDDFPHVVLPGRIAREDAVDLVRRVGRGLRGYAIEGRARPVSHFVYQSANPLQTRVVIGFVEVNGAADPGVNAGATQVYSFGRRPAVGADGEPIWSFSWPAACGCR